MQRHRWRHSDDVQCGLGIGELCLTFALLCYASIASKCIIIKKYYAQAYALPHGICACAVGLCTVLEWRGMAEASAEDLEIEPVPATPPSCDRPESSRTSILDRLKLPTKSDLARKRKIEKPKTTGADKKRKSSVPSPSNPNNVSPST